MNKETIKDILDRECRDWSICLAKRLNLSMPVTDPDVIRLELPAMIALCWACHKHDALVDKLIEATGEG